MAIQLLSLSPSFPPASWQLCLAFSFHFCLYLYILMPSLPLSAPPLSPFLLPHCLKLNTHPRINFDQSNILICLAEETVTYWRRSSYTDMKKPRRPISENISVLTQIFSLPFIFSHSLLHNGQIYPRTLYLLLWRIVPLCSRQMWEGRSYNQNYSWNQEFIFASSLIFWSDTKCFALLF